ncbi:hypothetical protein DV736_g5745, partial [Chaetothyriales sp. CBS 134916]
MVFVSASASTPSPKRPRSARLSLSIEASTDASVSPYASGLTDGTVFSGASSRTSQTSFFPPLSPVTPRPMSSRSSRRSFGGDHRRKSSRASICSISSTTSQPGGDMCLGNLADELAEADVEEVHGTLSSSFLDGLREGDHDDSGVADAPASPYADLHDRNRRSKSIQAGNTPACDGSDYGPGSDSEEETPSSLSLLLGKRMRSIERLVHDCGDVKEALSNGSGDVISYLTESLHSLGPTQADIEYGVTRMLTACNSIATHRTHAQRDLFSTSHALVYGHRIYMLSAETLDLLASELDGVSEALPVPLTTNAAHQNPLVSLSMLANDTSSLINTLRSLTDLLQETRLATNAATRKLKSVRDMVEELRVDEELVENSMLLIQAGDWDRRCRERQAASVCKEVVRGFGERWGIDVESSSGVRVGAA